MVVMNYLQDTNIIEYRNWQIKLKALCANHRKLHSELWITDEQQFSYLKEWLHKII